MRKLCVALVALLVVGCGTTATQTVVPGHTYLVAGYVFDYEKIEVPHNYYASYWFKYEGDAYEDCDRTDRVDVSVGLAGYYVEPTAEYRVESDTRNYKNEAYYSVEYLKSYIFRSSNYADPVVVPVDEALQKEYGHLIGNADHICRWLALYFWDGKTYDVFLVDYYQLKRLVNE